MRQIPTTFNSCLVSTPFFIGAEWKSTPPHGPPTSRDHNPQNSTNKNLSRIVRSSLSSKIYTMYRCVSLFRTTFLRYFVLQSGHLPSPTLTIYFSTLTIYFSSSFGEETIPTTSTMFSGFFGADFFPVGSPHHSNPTHIKENPRIDHFPEFRFDFLAHKQVFSDFNNNLYFFSH